MDSILDGKSPKLSDQCAADVHDAEIKRLAKIELFKRLGQNAYTVQADYGKWLTASVLGANLGGLLGIMQSGSYAEQLMHSVGWYLIVGVLVSIFTGGLTWINYSYVFHVYTKVQMREEFGIEVKFNKYTNVLLKLSFIAPIISFCVSAILLFIACFLALSAISRKPILVIYPTELPDWISNIGLVWQLGQ